jgi:hypothetical protein
LYCKRFHIGAAIGTLVVVLLLPLSLAMDDGEFDHGGGGGSAGGPAAAAAAVVAAVDDNWRQKRPAARALMVAWRHAMTKADGREKCNNQPTTGESKAGIGGGGNGNSNGSGSGGGGQ